MIRYVLLLLLVSCGSYEPPKDQCIWSGTECTRPSPTPLPNGCDVRDVPTGSIIACGDRTIIINDVPPEDTESTEEPPVVEPSPMPTIIPSPTPSNIVIYKCKHGKKKDKNEHEQ